MQRATEKLIIFFILTVNYLLSVSEPSVLLTLSAFILTFIPDVLKNKYVTVLSNVFLLFFLIIDFNFVYFLPATVYSLFIIVGFPSLLLLLPTIISQKWILVLLSILIFYLLNLSLKLSKEKELNKNMRDKLTEDNMRLRAQRNVLMKTHEKDVYLAGLNERNRIARDMHDALGHSLSSSILLIESLQYVKDESKLRESLSSLQNRLKEGMDDIRHSIHHLYDTSIDIEARIDSFLSDMTDYRYEFFYDVNLELKHEEKIDLLSIVREALTNIRKHSNASEITVVIKEHPKYLTLTIKDNGTLNQEVKKGMGIQLMTEIVQKYGGIMNAFYDKGFTVHAIFYKEGLKDEDSHSG